MHINLAPTLLHIPLFNNNTGKTTGFDHTIADQIAAQAASRSTGDGVFINSYDWCKMTHKSMAALFKGLGAKNNNSLHTETRAHTIHQSKIRGYFFHIIKLFQRNNQIIESACDHIKRQPSCGNIIGGYSQGFSNHARIDINFHIIRFGQTYRNPGHLLILHSDLDLLNTRFSSLFYQSYRFDHFNDILTAQGKIGSDGGMTREIDLAGSSEKTQKNISLA